MPLLTLANMQFTQCGPHCGSYTMHFLQNNPISAKNVFIIFYKNIFSTSWIRYIAC